MRDYAGCLATITSDLSDQATRAETEGGGSGNEKQGDVARVSMNNRLPATNRMTQSLKLPIVNDGILNIEALTRIMDRMSEQEQQVLIRTSELERVVPVHLEQKNASNP